MSQEIIYALIAIGIILLWIFPLWGDIIKWRTIPHPFTTGVWTVIVGLNLFILYLHGEFIGMAPVILVLTTLIWETIIGILQFKKIHINWFDTLCMISATFCVVYYTIYQNALYTVMLTILIDILAILPTFKKSWLAPWSETAINYFFSGLSHIFIVLSLEAPTSETMIFWIYIVGINSCLVVFMLSRRWYLKGWRSIFE